MLGLGGAYSQVLIDGRPIFNALMGLYGLEQIPANIIDRIEIVKGGGSAVYGSSAIGGTVNVITRKPKRDDYAISLQSGVIGGRAWDHNLQVYGTKVIKNNGITIQAGNRTRTPYDHNADGFSELPAIQSTNIGISGYHSTNRYGKLGVSVRHIHEYRRGGNHIDLPAIEADQAEERTHRITMGDINYEQAFPELHSNLSMYVSGQHTGRDHYTGIDHVDAYGVTESSTMNAGIQWNTFLDAHTLTFGTEYLLDDIYDEIPNYNYLVDQQVHQLGFFLQDEWKIHNRWTLLGGVRADQHAMLDKPAFSPRANVLFNVSNYGQLRASFSTGFRAPQAFDSDLHIAFAGGGVALVQLDPLLHKETSRSFALSFNLDQPSEAYIFGFTADVFHTRLFDAFTLSDGGTDDQGNTILIKSNGGNSTVAGINLEGRVNYNNLIEFDLGLTIQKSTFDSPVQWSEQVPGSRSFLRTPDAYGFYRLGYYPTEKLKIDLSGVYTGSMVVPHFGGAPGVPEDVLFQSPNFFAQDIKVSYDFPVIKNKLILNLHGGVRNVFNAYQDDFDTGRYRDSNYVYGPAQPRTCFLGMTLRN
jgi:outer membrane receptor for ferrienterochelin and colicins